MTRHAEVVKKAARLEHAAKRIFASAPARVMLPLAEGGALPWIGVLLHNRPLYQGVPHDTPRKIHQTFQNMLETHTPCEYSIGSPSSHFKQPWGGDKRYKSLTGKHGFIVSAIYPRVNHVMGV